MSGLSLVARLRSLVIQEELKVELLLFYIEGKLLELVQSSD